MALAVGSALTAQALEVKLLVTETDKVARAAAAITTGVPFGKGQVRDMTRLAVRVAGKPVPAQFLKLVSWDDGSIRWALMDVQADVAAGGTAELMVSDSGGNPPPVSPVVVDNNANEVKVSNGPLQFTVDKKKFNLFASLRVDGREVVTSAGRGLVLVKDDGGEVQAGAPSEVKLEQAGPMRAIVCVRGKFPGVHNGLLSYTARVTAFAGRKFVKVQVWLENDGAMGYFHAKEDWTGKLSTNAEWFSFKGMNVEFGLGEVGGSAACEGNMGSGSFKVMQVCKQGAASKKEGTSFYSWDDFAYTITSGGKEIKKGDRTDGVVQIKGKIPLTTAIRNFWQNYEKAIELDGGKLKLWLWPLGGQWPRPFPELCNQLYDATLVSLAKKANAYLLPGAVHKGHEFILDFSGRDAKESSAELSAPLFALASAEYYAATEAASCLFAPSEARTGNKICNIKLGSWDRMARSLVDPANPSNLQKARQYSAMSQIATHADPLYQFGWMDFGDVAVLGVGPTGLHYDWTWIMLLNTMRTGDINFLRMGSEMARHRMDIAQLWSDRDIPECRGLERGAGGCIASSAPRANFSSFHCSNLWAPPGPNENWLVGVAAYYMLTGEPQAMECCVRDAEGLKTSWAYFAKEKPYTNPLTDMSAIGWSISAYCAMYDLTADKQWLEEARKLFTGNVCPVWKKQGPFLFDPSRQWEGQDYSKEDMKYCYAITAFCELHRRTGDAQVLALLKEGCEKTFPDTFFDGPLFLSDLYAYVGYQTKNPDLLRKAADAFASTFPASKCPPTFQPNNTTWSFMTATKLRTGHLLQYACWKMPTMPTK